MKGKHLISVFIILLVLGLIGRSFYIGFINNSHYQAGKTLIESGEYEEARAELIKSNDYKDAAELIKQIDVKIAEEEKQKERDEIQTLFLDAQKKLQDKCYDESYTAYSGILEKIGIYELKHGTEDQSLSYLAEECEEKKKESLYLLAVQRFDAGDYNTAKELFSDEILKNYKDTKEFQAKINIIGLEQSQKVVYDKAVSLFENQKYEMAKQEFSIILDYKDSQLYYVECENRIRRRDLRNTLFVGIEGSGAITKNSTVVYVGEDFAGNLSTDSWENIVSIDGYNALAIGIDSNGSVVTAGKFDMETDWKNGQTVDSSQWIDVIDVAAGEQFVIALDKKHKVFFGGHDGSDLQEKIEEWDDIVAIDAGYTFAVGLTEKGELRFAGNCKKLEAEYLTHKDEWNGVVNIAAAGGNYESDHLTFGHVIGLKDDGTVVSIGDNNYEQCQTENWSNVIKVVAGDWYSEAITTEGKILITGTNQPGAAYIKHETVDNATGVIDIATGHGGTIFVDENGKYGSFGYDACGRNELVEIMNAK